MAQATDVRKQACGTKTGNLIDVAYVALAMTQALASLELLALLAKCTLLCKSCLNLVCISTIACQGSRRWHRCSSIELQLARVWSVHAATCSYGVQTLWTQRGHGTAGPDAPVLLCHTSSVWLRRPRLRGVRRKDCEDWVRPPDGTRNIKAMQCALVAGLRPKCQHIHNREL